MVAAPEAGPRRNAESVWQFLERSSEPVAADTRARWDEWLSRMPEEPRAALVSRLRGREDGQVRAALAELVTFVLLNSVYPVVEVEPETGTGSRTDFAVDVPVRTHFEVHRSSMPRQTAKDAQRQDDIASELERIDSPDFWLSVDVRTGAQVPSMRTVRQDVRNWLASLDYTAEVQRVSRDRQTRQDRMAGTPPPGLDASPAERARYFAANTPFQPPTFKASGEGWSVTISAHPRPADQRGPGQFTIGSRSAGEAHLATFEGLQAAVRNKLRQHAGLTDPLVVVLDLSSPIVADRDIAAMLYGPTTTALLDPDTPGPTTRNRAEGLWPDPAPLPPRPAAVLILSGIWLGSHEATAELWLPPGRPSPLLPGPWTAVTLGPDRNLITAEPAQTRVSDVLGTGSGQQASSVP
jgi:hypothetical protein